MKVPYTQSKFPYLKIYLLVFACVISVDSLSSFVHGQRLSDLSDQEIISIERACSDVKLREGTQAYNQCLRNQIEELRKTPQPPDLSGYSEQERNFLDLICGSEKNYVGPAAYYRCLEDEIESLEGVPKRHDISNLTEEELFSIYTVCGLSIAPRRGSFGEYKQCLMGELEALQKVTRPDLSGLSQGARESIESACRYYENYRGPAEYYLCLKRHVEEGTHYSESSSPSVTGSVEPPSSQYPQTNSTAADDVRRAQRLLQYLGYDPGPVDGRVGPRTRNAVIAFQTDRGVAPTGVIDDVLLAQLESTPRLSEDENAATPLPASVRPSKNKNVVTPPPDSEPILPWILSFAVIVFAVIIVIRTDYKTKGKTSKYPEPLKQKSSYQSPRKSYPEKQPAPGEQRKSSQTAHKTKAQSGAEVKEGINNFTQVKTEFETSLLYRLIAFNLEYRVKANDKSVKVHRKKGEECISYLEVISKPKTINGWLWDKIVLNMSGGRIFTIEGIKKAQSESAKNILNRLLGKFHSHSIILSYKKVELSSVAFKSLFSYGYTRHSIVEKWRKENTKLAQALDNDFALEFLPENKWKNVKNFLELYSRCHNIREDHNRKFIEKEKKNYKDYFDQVEKNPLTESQRLACIVNEDNNLVLAGAGSGKTSVIIAKAGYLIQAGLVKPHEILILAYGRKASKETDERIKEKLQNVEGVKTSTFHKLGLDIIGLAIGKKPNVSKLQEDATEFYLLINKLLTELTKQDSEFNQRVLNYFVTHLIPYKSEFEFEQKGEYFAALKEGDMRSLKSRIEWAKKRSGKVSLQQEQLKSFEEVVIADFLFLNGVEYIYEHPYKIDTATPEKTQYLPDFYLTEYDIYIEHFGINRDGKTPYFIDQKSYEKSMEWKRTLHKQNNTTLIETYSYEMQEGVLTDLLRTKLEKHGYKLSTLLYQELLELLNSIKEDKKESQFNELVVNFLDLFKQSGSSFKEVRELSSRHPDKMRCHAFLDIFESVFQRYTLELEMAGTVDFSDMIRKAIDLVDRGQYRSPYKYILVDEFQDISAIRAGLVQSLIKSGGNTSLACVGDDWQSIYRFSGSDINYTGKFEDYFGYTKKITLDKSFRFNNKINRFATTFITENPAQLKKDITSHTHTDSNAITLVKYYQDVDRAIQGCVEDIISNGLQGKSIYILGRYSFSKPSFLQTLSGQYPQFYFSYDTVHASKGKEADYVIVVDVNDDRYGFPSKIANDSLLDLVLPPAEPYEYAEERRLFYVAVTRSKNHSYILYDVEKPSVFVKEVRSNRGRKYSFNEISTEGVKSAPTDYGNCPSCGTGKIRRRESRFENFFFGCSHYPLCSYIPRTCEECNKYPLVRSGNIYKCLNQDCNYTAKACQRCNDGIMVKRKGKYGEFWGCSNYGKTKCLYTEKISH